MSYDARKFWFWVLILIMVMVAMFTLALAIADPPWHHLTPSPPSNTDNR
jgi:Mn2+/Fe2+ NRAMP family transporter